MPSDVRETSPLKNTPPDRRIERTRLSLAHALIELMQERGWEEIDVQALCARANVGRSTFYEHFPNKEALLASSLEGLKAGLLAHAAAAPGGQAMPLAFVPGLIAHVHQMQHLFRVLVGRRSGQYVQERFRELLVDLVLADTPRTRPAWQATARAHYLGGALFELLGWWLGSNRPHSPQEIEAVFRQWSAAAVA